MSTAIARRAAASGKASKPSKPSKPTKPSAKAAPKFDVVLKRGGGKKEPAAWHRTTELPTIVYEIVGRSSASRDVRGQHPRMHKVISLVAKASSALKTEGWSRFVEAAKERGPLVVTHRNRPEAVVLSTAEFDRLMLIAEQEDARRAKVLSDLSASFDQRLAGLKAPGAAEALDRVMTEPLDLQGKLRAGQGF